MLKILFWGLLFANGILFAYDRGVLGSFASDGREPARMMNQRNADKIKLIPAIPPPPPATVPVIMPVALAVSAIPPSTPTSIACTEIGNFEAADARRFETQLTGVGASMTQRNIKEAARHMVYIPSQGDKDAAERKSGELKRLGVNDFFVIQENSDLRWGISLGIFKTEDAARLHLTNLVTKGVRSARLGTHSATSNRVAFQLRDADQEMKSKLDKIKAAFPRQELRGCGAG